jgi:uncharacterized membrane protein
MAGVERVQQLDDKRLHWVAMVGGKRHEWEAEITEQVPDHRIAWRSNGGEVNAGEVLFQPLGAARSRVAIRLHYQPEGAVEKLGDMLGVVSSRVEGDLERFKDFIEARGRETGAWRGTIR